MIIIPKRETKNIVQLNQSKVLGDFWASFNMDLQSDLGVIKVSPRMKLAENSSLANFGLPVAFRHFDNRIYTIAGTRVFKSGTNAYPGVTNYGEDTSTGYKDTYDPRWSDMEIFNGQLFTTTNDELMSKAPAPTNADGAWTERDGAFSDETTPHFLCYFKKFDRLYYNDGDVVQSIDTTYTLAQTGDYSIDLNFEEGETISCVKATSTSIFIGTMRQSNIQGDIRGNVYEWDGISDQVTAKYRLNNQGAMAMLIKDDIPWIMDARGALGRFTGYSFQEVGRLPRSSILPYNLSSNDNDRWIHPNGFIVTEDDTFLVLVNNKLGDNSASVLENMPSGIWEFSEKNGFVHKYSIGYTSDTTITDYGQQKVSVVGALANMNLFTTNASRNGQYVCGVTYFTDGSSTSDGLFYDDSNDTLQKIGYFITPWLLASEVNDYWTKLCLKYRQLLNSADRIIVKKRTVELAPVYIDITWNDTSSFHTSTDMTAYDDTDYEVEIIQGVGSGRSFNIKNISSNNPWKVNIDGVMTGATGTAKARLQKWQKVVVIDNQDTESDVTELDDISMRVQLKVILQFTGEGEFYELVLINQAHENL